MIRTFRITVLVEEVTGPDAHTIGVAQFRSEHFVDERSLYATRYPSDWLRAELEVPLKRASHDLAPTVYAYINPASEAASQ